MDGQQYVRRRVGRETHETDRHSIDLLALIYQALLDDRVPQRSHLGSEQPVSATRPGQPLVQEAQT